MFLFIRKDLLVIRITCTGLALLGILSMLVSCERFKPEVVDNTPESSYPQLCGANTPTLATAMLQNLDAPLLRSGIGTAQLRITTASPQAQKWFNQGLNYLHGFWYLEAYRAFQQVVAYDPICAMGYWGIAMCQPGFGGDNFSVWQGAIAKAADLATAARPVEKGLINALYVTAFQDLNAAAGSWSRLAENFPQEPEVVAFAAIMLRQVVQTQADSDAVKQLVEETLARFPEHIGLLHYYVHIMEERPDFALAIEAAEKLVQLAPNNSHLVHMPGHLYFLEGDYARAAKSFEAARMQELDYHQEHGIVASIDQNYLHNLHYLAVVYSELNEREKALEVARKMAYLTLRQNPPTDGASWMLLYEGRILPAWVHIRLGEYAAAAKEIGFWLTTELAPLENQAVRYYLSAVQYYCYAMDFALRGEHQRAFDYGNQMVAYLNQYEQAGADLGPGEMVLASQAFEILSVLRYELGGWLNNLDPHEPFRAVEWDQGLALETQLPYDEPPRLMYPLAESLARLHRYRNDLPQAQEALNNALRRRPNSPIIQSLSTTLSKI